MARQPLRRPHIAATGQIIGIQHRQHADFVPGGAQLLGYLIGDTPAERIAAKVIGSVGLDFLDFPDIVRRHLLHREKGCGLAVEADALDSVERLRIAQVARQVAKIQHVAVLIVDTEKGRPVPVRLDRDHASRRNLGVDATGHFRDRAGFEEDRPRQSMADLRFDREE